MAKIVNLRTIRKRRAREEDTKRAAENAARFGRTKAQKTLEETRAELSRRRLDAHRRDDD
ncbi:uncharacterized protein DUF4169 [Albidovulum inexpectatum]|uniref:Uncharacterized protein DUF4169 n=1 Tax=Albidovulum inexpectatum TaxID=196587 RepID=A0A2S5JEU7_9RHOB|nr:DUF4169 family protein [Albidovulum inexpectatum]PPB80042.1 uncharacterized protein DUF4169 [Albidovulum inexpectatum]